MDTAKQNIRMAIEMCEELEKLRIENKKLKIEIEKYKLTIAQVATIIKST